MELFGQGVLIGVVDTGIDYRHPAFMNNDQTTRIISIWDQTDQTGTPPESFTFGTEYLAETINIALKSPQPLSLVPTTDEIGHGTMVAGIAAGNIDLPNDFRGVAPNTELAVVKLKQAKPGNREIFGIKQDAICYQESDIIFGLRYLVDLAARLNRPLAVCIAMGTSQEDHNGIGALSNYVNLLSRTPSIGIVIAGGNEGDSRRHFSSTIDLESHYADFELQVGSADTSFSMEIWQSSPHRLMLEIASPTGERVREIYPALNDCREIDFIFETSTLWINNIILETESGDQLILVRFETPMAGTWRFRVYDIDKLNIRATFNVWLPAGSLLSNETYFLSSDPFSTLTAPANSRSPISVTAYNQQDGSILSPSSRGYPLNGWIKPDFAAPGFELSCPLPANLYGSATGTGPAAAYTTGLVALMLEWAVVKGNYTTITGSNIGKLLIRGTSRTTNQTYPNRIWGYGIVDIAQTFNLLRL